MAKKLKELSGKFNADGQYNLAEYNLYLNSLVLSSKEIQTEVRNVARKFIETIMVEGKWYDDSAAEFAQWWDSQGVAHLNKISTVVEELVRITATDVCHKMKKSEQTAKSYKKYGKIQKFADSGDQYVLGIENITKDKLGYIKSTECREGAVLMAEEQALTSLANTVSTQFDRVDEHITQIKKLITVNLINGEAIKFAGLESSVLKNKVNNVKEHLEEIQNALYNNMQNAQNITNDTTKQIKAVLSTNYVKGGGEKEYKGDWDPNMRPDDISNWNLVN